MEKKTDQFFFTLVQAAFQSRTAVVNGTPEIKGLFSSLFLFLSLFFAFSVILCFHPSVPFLLLPPFPIPPLWPPPFFKQSCPLSSSPFQPPQQLNRAHFFLLSFFLFFFPLFLTSSPQVSKSSFPISSNKLALRPSPLSKGWLRLPGAPLPLPLLPTTTTTSLPLLTLLSNFSYKTKNPNLVIYTKCSVSILFIFFLFYFLLLLSFPSLCPSTKPHKLANLDALRQLFHFVSFLPPSFFFVFVFGCVAIVPLYFSLKSFLTFFFVSFFLSFVWIFVSLEGERNGTN